jgi:hypothetical protein
MKPMIVRLMNVAVVAAGLGVCLSPEVFAETAQQGSRIDTVDPDLSVDLNLPPGALRGQRLKEWHESELQQDVGAFDQEIRAILKERTNEFAVVAAKIDSVYNSLDKIKQAAFSSEYEATKRDLDRLRELALYNCTFPVSAEVVRRATGRTDLDQAEYMSTVIVSQKLIDMWHQGMMSWGVYYDITKARCWPTGILTDPPTTISEGGQRIYKGDWRGAWLLNGGRVYVPGVAFFTLTKLNNLMAQQGNSPLSPRENEITSFWETIIRQLKDVDISQLDKLASNNKDGDSPVIVSINLMYDNGKLRPISDTDRSLEPNHYMTLAFEKNFRSRNWSITAFDNQNVNRKYFVYGNGIDIRYSYMNDFLRGHIAKSAKAFQNGALLAEANAIRRIETSMPYQIEIQETQYDKNGKKSYTGMLTISLGERGEVTGESVASGKKSSKIFNSWATGKTH